MEEKRKKRPCPLDGNALQADSKQIAIWQRGVREKAKKLRMSRGKPQKREVPGNRNGEKLIKSQVRIQTTKAGRILSMVPWVTNSQSVQKCVKHLCSICSDLTFSRPELEHKSGDRHCIMASPNQECVHP